jgi:hypothetical protein
LTLETLPAKVSPALRHPALRHPALRHPALHPPARWLVGAARRGTPRGIFRTPGAPAGRLVGAARRDIPRAVFRTRIVASRRVSARRSRGARSPAPAAGGLAPLPYLRGASVRRDGLPCRSVRTARQEGPVLSRDRGSSNPFSVGIPRRPGPSLGRVRLSLRSGSLSSLFLVAGLLPRRNSLLRRLGRSCPRGCVTAPFGTGFPLVRMVERSPRP